LQNNNVPGSNKILKKLEIPNNERNSNMLEKQINYSYIAGRSHRGGFASAGSTPILDDQRVNSYNVSAE